MAASSIRSTLTSPAFRFPPFERATAHHCQVGPGEVLCLPADWWHHVVAVEESITLSFEFVNATDFNSFLTALLRNLPDTVQLTFRCSLRSPEHQADGKVKSARAKHLRNGAP